MKKLLTETPEQDNNTLTEVLKEIDNLIYEYIEIKSYSGEPAIEGKADLLKAIGQLLKSNYELKSKQ